VRLTDIATAMLVTKSLGDKKMTVSTKRATALTTRGHSVDNEGESLEDDCIGDTLRDRAADEREIVPGLRRCGGTSVGCQRPSREARIMGHPSKMSQIHRSYIPQP
jgi:hypothetical protein